MGNTVVTHVFSWRTVRKRLLVFAVLAVLAATSFVYYVQNKEAITHFRPYYTQSYLRALAHKFANSNWTSRITKGTDNARSVPVLVYHGLLSKADSVSTSVNEFADEMFELKKQGYQTVHFNDFLDYINGKKKLPDKSFLLTFDDGRKDSYYPVDPILAELNYSAVMFMITGTLDANTNNFHLTKSEAEQMKNSGRWDLEAHTYKGHGLIQVDPTGNKGHFYSNKMWLTNKNRLETDDEFRQRVRSDLLQAKNDMKSYFGVDAQGFAFPFNDYAAESINFPNAKMIFDQEIQSIYKLLFFQAEPKKGFATNLYSGKQQRIKRVNVDTNWKKETLLATLSEIKEKDMPINLTNFSSTQGWVQKTGSQHFKDGSLLLQSNEESRGSFSILDGTASLGNFNEDVVVDIQKDSTISLSFRQNQSDNFYYVTIYPGGTKLSHSVNGQDSLIADENTSFNNIAGKHKITLRVINKQVFLAIDDNKLIDNKSYAIDNPTGAIGFEAWNSLPDSAFVKITLLHISSVEQK